MIIKVLKYPWRFVKKTIKDRQTHNYVVNRVNAQLPSKAPFEFSNFKSTILAFIRSMQADGSGIHYHYSVHCNQATLYSSAYACMTLSLLNEISKLPQETKESWINYFQSFQREEDGLFYDGVVRNEHYGDSDWWGARHLALHMISAYAALDARPKHPFRFLERYYNEEYLMQWLKENEDAFLGAMDHDFDNKVMNISCLLQYQRDFWNDKDAGLAVERIQKFLLKKINPTTGIWGDDNITDPFLRSRKVQFAYHLFPMFFYDQIYDFDLAKVVDVAMRTQNKFGGFSPVSNSSACEDIDSMDILMRLCSFIKDADSKIDETLRIGLKWILLNQMEDGGFVFRLNEPFTYGHDQLSSPKNTGAVFPTWFRVLNIAYVCRLLKIPTDFKITRCPGYEF